MNALRLKNYNFRDDPMRKIWSLQTWLFNQMLHGSQSRERTRFIKLIAERGREIEEVRMDLLKKHAEKNDKGETLYLDHEGKETTVFPENGKYKITPQNEDLFVKEYAEYLKEELIIDVTEANKSMISTIGTILAETTFNFEGVMSERYDEWCIAFENVFSKNQTKVESIKQGETNNGQEASKEAGN